MQPSDGGCLHPFTKLRNAPPAYPCAIPAKRTICSIIGVFPRRACKHLPQRERTLRQRIPIPRRSPAAMICGRFHSPSNPMATVPQMHLPRTSLPRWGPRRLLRPRARSVGTGQAISRLAGPPRRASRPRSVGPKAHEQPSRFIQPARRDNTTPYYHYIAIAVSCQGFFSPSAAGRAHPLCSARCGRPLT